MQRELYEQWNEFQKNGFQPFLQLNAQFTNAAAHASERMLRQCLSAASDLAHLNMNYAPRLTSAKNLENALGIYSEWLKDYSAKCAEQAHEWLDTYVSCYADLSKYMEKGMGQFAETSKHAAKEVQKEARENNN